MPLTIQYTPGYVWTVGEIVTEDKLNLASNPLINLFGSISTASIADGSVTNTKLAVGVLSADATGRALMAAGYFTADAGGRGKFASAFVNAGLMDDGTRTEVPGYAAGVFTTNVYAVTLSPAISAYAEGQTIRFKADTANAGACSVNVNAIGNKAIKKNINQDPQTGDITAGEVVSVTYDGTNFQLGGRHAPVAVLGSAKNLASKVNTGTPNSKADITADEIILKDTNNNGFVATTVSVTADVTASGANGLDTGSEANSTWYYLWVIYNPTTNTVAALLSASSTAPTMPSGYTFKALSATVFNNAAGNFTAYLQLNREVFIDEINLFTAVTATTANTYQSFSTGGANALTTVVPPIAKTLRGIMGSVAGQNPLIAVAGDANGLGAQYVNMNGNNSFASWGACANFEIPLATAQTLYWKSFDNSTARNRVSATGYSI